MTVIAERLAGQTVRPRLSLVNTLVPMDRQGGTDQPDENTPGRRLERYIKGRWTRRQGGILGLASAINSSTETIYAWFRGDSEPSMAHLRELADKLGVRRAVLVAILDGDPLPGEAEQVSEVLEARLRAIEAELQSLREHTGAEESRGRSAPRATAG